MNPIHCPNKMCGKKLADHMEDGLYLNTCPKCKTSIYIDRRVPEPVA